MLAVQSPVNCCWPTPSLPAGLACDPATGEVISCKPGATRQPTRTWRGRTAKAVSVDILEADHGFHPVTHLEHANYLGRELQRAEFALLSGQRYVQD
jgi:dihydropteroate synthase